MTITFFEHSLLLTNAVLLVALALLIYFRDDRGIAAQILVAGFLSLFLPGISFSTGPRRPVSKRDLNRWRRLATDVARLTGRRPTLLIDDIGPRCLVTLRIGK